jgi:hypothetical protein
VFKTSLFLPSQRNMFPASLMSKWLWWAYGDPHKVIGELITQLHEEQKK